ncbi:hypothetical protein CR513_20858, partial [Mucuna pruriens]
MGRVLSLNGVVLKPRNCLCRSPLHFDLIVDTPANDSIVTFLVCLKYLVYILEKEFIIDLICLPLNQLDVILESNIIDENLPTIIRDFSYYE